MKRGRFMNGFEDDIQAYEQLTLDDLYDFGKVRS